MSYGGVDSSNGTYGPVGPETGSSPSPNPSQGPAGPAGPAGPSIDRWAATRIVSLSPDVGTDTTIQAAIDNLPAEGGTIFVKQGAYALAASLVLPDKPVVFDFAGGAVLRPAGDIEIFAIPDGLSAVRLYTFLGLQVAGDPTANQKLFAFKDVNARGQVAVYRPDVIGVRNIFDIQAGDNTFINAVSIWVENGQILPTGVGVGHLVKTPNPFDSFTFGSFAIFTGVKLNDDAISAAWLLDYDGDLVLSRCRNFTVTGSCGATGFDVENSQVIGFTSSAVDEIQYDAGVWLTNSIIRDTNFVQIAIHTIAFQLTISDFFLILGAKIVVDGPFNVIKNARVSGFGVPPANPAAIIDILAGADRATITGGSIYVNTAACTIQNAAQKTVVSGVGFIGNDPIQKAFIDVGAGDFSLLTGCTGIGVAGANVTLAGNSRAVLGTGINFA